jgi:hypothetical protein
VWSYYHESKFGGCPQRERYAEAVVTTTKVELAALKHWASLIPGAQGGKLTTRLSGSADAGWSGCTAFAWDKQQAGYQGVELGTYGDTVTENDSNAAREIGNWLRGVLGRISLYTE